MSDPFGDPIVHSAAAQSVGQALSQVVSNKDLQEMVKPTGEVIAQESAFGMKTLLGFLNALGSPMRLFAMQKTFEETRFAKELAFAIEQTPPARLVSPKPHVAVAVLQSAPFMEDEPELRRLYVNLLARSMDRATAQQAHPGFAEIIKQLTPDEARVLAFLKPHDAEPLINISEVNLELKSMDMVVRHLSNLGEGAECQYPEMTDIAIDNLCRLGLTEIPFAKELAQEDAYAKLDASLPVMIRQNIAEGKGLEINIEHRMLQYTVFGEQFWRACVLHSEYKEEQK